jgi:hypothetical protein
MFKQTDGCLVFTHYVEAAHKGRRWYDPAFSLIYPPYFLMSSHLASSVATFAVLG